MAERKTDSTLSINHFRSLNLRDAPVSMRDDELALCINFMPIGSSLFTIPGETYLYDISLYGNIIRSKQVIFPSLSGDLHFTDDGKVVFVNSSGSIQDITPIGVTFTNASFAQWKYTNALIIDPMAGYYQFDGTTCTVVDSKLYGTSIEVWQGRVWIANRRTIAFTAPDDGTSTAYANFDTAQGAGAVIDSYSSLASVIKAIRAIGDYLYVIGDHAVHLVYGLQITSSANTIFNLSDAIHRFGTTCGDSVVTLDRSVVFANDTGIHLVSGNDHVSIGDYFDGFFKNALNTSSPIYGIAPKINGKRVFCLLVNGVSPLSGYSQQMFLGLNNTQAFMVIPGLQLDGTQSRSFSSSFERFTQTGSETLGTIGGKVYRIFDDSNYDQIRRVARLKAFEFGYPAYDKEVIKVGFSQNIVSGDSNSISRCRINVSSETDRAGQDKDLSTDQYVGNNRSDYVFYNSDGSVFQWSNLSWSVVNGENLSFVGTIGRGKRISMQFDEMSTMRYSLTGAYINYQIGREF